MAITEFYSLGVQVQIDVIWKEDRLLRQDILCRSRSLFLYPFECILNSLCIHQNLIIVRVHYPVYDNRLRVIRGFKCCRGRYWVSNGRLDFYSFLPALLVAPCMKWTQKIVLSLLQYLLFWDLFFIRQKHISNFLIRVRSVRCL